MKENWNFHRGGGFTEQTPYMGRATHFILVQRQRTHKQEEVLTDFQVFKGHFLEFFELLFCSVGLSFRLTCLAYFINTGKNNGFPFLVILGYLKNTHKNPKFGKVRQVPTREFPTKFPGWDLSHSSKFGIFVGIL